MRNKVACCGAGWVGSATYKMLDGNVTMYDPFVKLDNPLREFCLHTTKEDVNAAELCIIGVPTPLLPDNTLDTSIVEEIVSWCECPMILIRSTINPGTVDYLKAKYKKRLVFQAEFLGETPNHNFIDMKTRPFIILGGDDKDTQEIVKFYTTIYNANVNIRQLTAREAEIAKLTENRAIGFKVMQCHELYLACKADGTNYYKIRDAVFGDDPRFDLWFSFIYFEPTDTSREVLGFDSSKCLKKDIPAWCAWAESVRVDPSITRKLVLKSREWWGKSAAEILEERKITNHRVENGVYS